MRGILFLIIGLVIFLSACEEDPGCLDVQASNYQVDAEDPCGDCCTYPAFRLSLRHRWSSLDTVLTFSVDTTVFSTVDQDLRFDGLHFYLSGIRLVRADGSTLSVFDDSQVTLERAGDSVRVDVKEDVLLAAAGSFRTHVLGSYRGEGIFESIQFEFGAPAQVASASPDLFPDRSPLAAQTPSMYDENQGYRTFRVSVYPDRQDTSPRIISAFSSDTLPTITLPISFQLDRGYFTDISLAIDYRNWFEGLDWTNLTDEEAANFILDQLQNSVQVISVTSSLN